jgi:hypothetical protein
VQKGPLTTWWNGRWYSPNVLFRYRRHVSVRHTCLICFCLSPSLITYSPCFSSIFPLALLSGQLSHPFPLDIKRRPTQCFPRHFTQFLIYVVLEVVTMAMVGTTVVLPMVAPLSAPTRFLFDAVNDLLKM